MKAGSRPRPLTHGRHGDPSSLLVEIGNEKIGPSRFRRAKSEKRLNRSRSPAAPVAIMARAPPAPAPTGRRAAAPRPPRPGGPAAGPSGRRRRRASLDRRRSGRSVPAPGLKRTAMNLFDPGFSAQRIAVAGTVLHVRVRPNPGKPALLLLHCWHLCQHGQKVPARFRQQ